MAEATLPLLIEQRQMHDQEFHDVYSMTTQGRPTYELLLPPKIVLEQKRQTFFDSGCSDIVDLCPQGFDSAGADAREQLLLDTKSALLEVPGSDWLKQAYRWRINEDIGNIRMLRSAANGDKHRFERYNYFVYGNPDPEIFAATADWFRDFAKHSPGPEADRVLELVPDMGGDLADIVPDPEVFKAIRQQHYREDGYYSMLLAGVELPESGKVDRESGDVALQKVLNNLHSDYEVADAEGSTWSLSHYDQKVKRPAKYNMSENRFVGLGLGHEIGSHLLEFENGRRSGFNLLSGGLDRYENGNEGRAVIREQVPYESFEKFTKLTRWQDIMRRHFAISLAEGLAGEKMAFPQVFQIVNAVDRLWENHKKPGSPEVANAKADKRSWDLLVRVLKGTDGNGGAYRKDIVYLEGNVAAWRVAKEHPEMVRYGDLGKFDIGNPRHVALLQAVGVLPKHDE